MPKSQNTTRYSCCCTSPPPLCVDWHDCEICAFPAAPQCIVGVGTRFNTSAGMCFDELWRSMTSCLRVGEGDATFCGLNSLFTTRNIYICVYIYIYSNYKYIIFCETVPILRKYCTDFFLKIRSEYNKSVWTFYLCVCICIYIKIKGSSSFVVFWMIV